MTSGNLFKQKFQNAFNFFIDVSSFEKKLTDHQMECMQFGICDYSPKQVEEVPFFHYKISLIKEIKGARLCKV